MSSVYLKTGFGFTNTNCLQNSSVCMVEFALNLLGICLHLLLSGMYDNAVKGMQKYMMRKGIVPDSEGLELVLARPCQVIWEVQQCSPHAPWLSRNVLLVVKGLCQVAAF